MAGVSEQQARPHGNTNGTMPPPATTNGTIGDDMTTTTAPGLSADEIALYDRQIRLWGAQAQERIRSAHVLLISLRSLGTEIAKNLTLAGISSLTIIDDEPVTEEDLGTQYFVREEDVGKSRAQAAIPRIQELNPRVTVKSDGSLNDLLAKDQTYYTPFDCVIACDHDFMTLFSINTAARFASRPFYAAGIHGFYGYVFADLVGHEFVVERDKSNKATTIGAETLTRSVLSVTSKKESSGKNVEIVKKQEIYCPLLLANSSPLPMDVLGNRRKLKAVPALLPCLRALFDFQRTYARLPGHTSQELTAFTSLATTKSRELQLPPETLRSDFLRSFIQNIGAEMVPTAAFVGGRLSEDVINVLGKREQPIQNFALFDGDGLDGRIYCLYSPPPEMAMAMMDGMAPLMPNDVGMGMGMDVPMVDGTGMMIPGMPTGDGVGEMLQTVSMVDGTSTMLPDPAMDSVLGAVPQDAMASNGLNAGPTSAPTNGSEMVNQESEQKQLELA